VLGLDVRDDPVGQLLDLVGADRPVDFVGAGVALPIGAGDGPLLRLDEGPDLAAILFQPAVRVEQPDPSPEIGFVPLPVVAGHAVFVLAPRKCGL
jgi:hypothetical protein